MKKGNIYKGAISTSREEHVYILVTDVECGPKIGKGNYINFTSNPPPNFESTMTLEPSTIPDYWFKKKKKGVIWAMIQTEVYIVTKLKCTEILEVSTICQIYVGKFA